MSEETKDSLLNQRKIAGVNKGKERKHSFDVDCSHIQEDFVGRFHVHHPTQMEKIDIGVKRTRLLDGLDQQIDVETKNIAHIIATLDTVMDSFPEWFDLKDPYIDYEVLESVYMKYAEWMRIFRDGRKRKATSEGAGS